MGIINFRSINYDLLSYVPKKKKVVKKKKKKVVKKLSSGEKQPSLKDVEVEKMLSRIHKMHGSLLET